jgi:hypothetical protein
VDLEILIQGNEEPVVDEQTTVKPPGKNEFSANYDVQNGENYRILIITDDGVTGDYQWDLSSRGSNNLVLFAAIEQGKVNFGVSTP